MKIRTKKILLSVSGILVLVASVLATQYLLAGIGISLAAIFVSVLVDQGSGKVGDLVISRNKAGNYLKHHKKPADPRTESQQSVRRQMQYLVKAWGRILTVQQRNAWNNYAGTNEVSNKFGFKVLRSGFQMFMRFNSKIVDILTSSMIVSPPTLSTMWPTMDWAAECTTSPVGISITPNISEGTIPALAVLYVRATPVMSPGISKLPKTKNILVSNAAIEDGIPINITDAYVGVFGNPESAFMAGGFQIQFEIQLINSLTGERMTPVIINYSQAIE